MVKLIENCELLKWKLVSWSHIIETGLSGGDFPSQVESTLRKNWVNLTHLNTLALVPKNIHVDESNW